MTFGVEFSGALADMALQPLPSTPFSKSVMMTNEQEPNNMTDEPIGDAPEESAAANEPTAEDLLAAAEAENGELRDKVLRMAAEMENLRKRTEREIADARSYGISGFARDMLVATDNLSRALMVVPQEARDAADGTLKSLIEGIEMTEREMQRLLQKHGVNPIEAQGAKFDPNFHQAMFEVPDTSVPEGTVVQVVQAGFVIGDRVLRPAMVGVAKGGPKRGASGTPAEGAETGDGVDKTA